jgi:23S rRNA pseudouridine1911/1915/1917 synthase
MPPLVILTDRRDRGQTLAGVLKQRLSLPWSKAKQTIERRHVRVGGQIVADGAYRVKAGQRITIAAGAIEAPAATSQKEKVKRNKETPKPKSNIPHRSSSVLYSDEQVVVVNKPAGLTTMRHAEEAAEFGRGKRFLPKTLADQLPTLMGEPGVRVIAAHRIDRDTSGLVVFAKTSAAANHLTKQFRTHTVERKYLALVRGVPKSEVIESTLLDDRGDGRRGSGEGGKRAVTHVIVREQFNGFALVECRLETGRTHQVRIHLGEAGTPLCGETVYDRPLHGSPQPDASDANRPMLHAAVLGFTHPATGERLRFETDPPEDFAGLLDRLRRH